MFNKITFSVLTIAIAAVAITGISTTFLNNGIQVANAQGPPNGYPPNANPQGPTGTPYGQYLSDPNRGFVGQDGSLSGGIQDYLQQQQQQGDSGLGDIRANDKSGIGEKYNPGGFGDFTDIENSPP